MSRRFPSFRRAALRCEGGQADRVNTAQTQQDLVALRLSVTKSRPFCAAAWRESMVRELGLESSVHRSGRAKKSNDRISTLSRFLRLSFSMSIYGYCPTVPIPTGYSTSDGLFPDTSQGHERYLNSPPFSSEMRLTLVANFSW